MPSISESLNSQSQLAEGLAAGVGSLSSNQQVTFTTYARSTIPTDGYVFYVNTGVTTVVQGSLHYSVDRQQNEDETNDSSRVVFTALTEVDVFNEVAPGDLLVGTWDGIQFAFSGRGPLYQQSGLYHYFGFKVAPALATQLIDSASDLPLGPIVSNSMPIWLAQSTIGPIYPSHLVPANIAPPYVSVHIEPSQTVALQAFPVFDWSGAANPNTDPDPLYQVPSWQLMRDSVRLVMYGFTNQQAIQFYASLMDYSVNADEFGFCTSPAIRDEKRAQADIAAIAMKKTLEFQASYYQSAADAVARRLILSASMSLTAATGRCASAIAQG